MRRPAGLPLNFFNHYGRWVVALTLNVGNRGAARDDHILYFNDDNIQVNGNVSERQARQLRDMGRIKRC
jgi:hypothetical protein